ncbi:hypothetical protein ACFRMQ_03525 [Kitasatospora sp. NPDC056783]|uniref:hypothetical protein n=1 Tax=Kitasatospora sp. NPDC056783 TaxID=3345943 RepID=UPI0036CE88AF
MSRHRPARPLRASVAALAAGAALLAATGCSGTSSASPDGATATGPYGEPLIAVDTDLRQPYLSYWDEWTKVARAADDRAAPLDAHADEPNLSILRASVGQMHQDNRRMAGEVKHRLLGMRVDGEARRIYDCVDLNAWKIVDTGTGQEIEQVGERPEQLSVMTMRQINGVWKVTDIQNPLPCPGATTGPSPRS